MYWIKGEKTHPKRAPLVAKFVGSALKAQLLIHLEETQTAPIQFLLFGFSQFHLQYSKNYRQWMIGGLTGTESQNDFPGKGSARILLIPYCMCWLSHLYQEQRQSSMIQIPEAPAITLLLKS